MLPLHRCCPCTNAPHAAPAPVLPCTEDPMLPRHRCPPRERSSGTPRFAASQPGHPAPCPALCSLRRGVTVGEGRRELAGALPGSALPRQQLRTCQRWQNFPFGLCLRPQALQSSAGLRPGDISLGTCQARLCQASSPAQGSVRDHGGSWGVGGHPSRVPWGEQEGSCPPKPDYAHHSPRKGAKAANFCPASAARVLQGLFLPKSWGGTAAENLVKAF